MNSVVPRFGWIADDYRNESELLFVKSERANMKNKSRKRRATENAISDEQGSNILQVTFNTKNVTGNKIVCEHCNQLFTKYEKYIDHCRASGHGKTENLDDDITIEIRPKDEPLYDYDYLVSVGKKFIVPAFYCQICAEVFGSLEEVDIHTKSFQHLENLKMLK